MSEQTRFDISCLEVHPGGYYHALVFDYEGVPDNVTGPDGDPKRWECSHRHLKQETAMKCGREMVKNAFGIKLPCSQRDIDIAYHKRCRNVCESLGIKLVGATYEDGFTYAIGSRTYEMPHELIEVIEGLVASMDGG